MVNFLPPYIENRMTQRAKNVFATAAYLCAAYRRSEISPILLLLALSLEGGSLSKNILGAHHLTYEAISSKGLGKKVPPQIQKTTKRRFPLQSGVRAIIKKSAHLASVHNQPYIGTEHLLYALVLSISHKSSSRHNAKKSDSSEERKLAKTLTEKKLTQIKKHIDTILSQNVNFSNFPNLATHDMGNNNLDIFDAQRGSDEIFGVDSLSGGRQVSSGDSVKPHGEEPKQINKSKKREHYKPKKSVAAKTSIIAALCENLSELADSGRLDPVIGRDKEMSRIINILSRRTKNNPLLIGEPGVGKTAIVHGLAQKIYEGDVPECLLYKSIYALNLNSLVAGTMFRGDFESRMRDILDEASKKNIILFIDEIHTVVGAGSAQGSLDVANILKPALSQGKLHCIGATTLEEYRRYIEKERALERRFQTVFIQEESEAQSIETLSRLKALYEKHHDIYIEEEAIESAVKLSARYIRNRFLPDKAMDVLDEAASKVRGRATIAYRGKKIKAFDKQRALLKKQKETAIAKEKYRDAIFLKYKEDVLEEEAGRFKKRFPLSGKRPVLGTHHIEETVSEISGIPIKAGQTQRHLLKKIASSIKRDIVGQDAAVNEILYVLKRNRLGLSNPDRPLGSFLFLGPSGVGKTSLAKSFAAHSATNLIKLDMSEYSEAHTVSRLIGSPPGYVGYEEAGELTEKIRRNPYSIVLFDEIEKAHPQVHNLLLSILEDGTLADSSGHGVSFKNAVIILTLNTAGLEYLGGGELGFAGAKSGSVRASRNGRSGQDFKKIEAKYINAAREALRPEIINRIDSSIVFDNLGREETYEVTKIFLDNFKNRLLPRKLQVPAAVVEYIAQRSYKPQEGARLVRSCVERMVERPVTEYLINRDLETIKLSIRRGKIVVNATTK